MGFRHTGHACSFKAIAERPARTGARRDACVIVSTGEFSTSEESDIFAYVRASIARCSVFLLQFQDTARLSSRVLQHGNSVIPTHVRDLADFRRFSPGTRRTEIPRL